MSDLTLHWLTKPARRRMSTEDSEIEYEKKGNPHVMDGYRWVEVDVKVKVNCLSSDIALLVEQTKRCNWLDFLSFFQEV